MPALVCALSEKVPEKPVVSKVSGALFEKSLIIKHINEFGRDPVNNEPLSEDLLIDVKVPDTVTPRPTSATSVPEILKSLQDEWDSTTLHIYNLRRQLLTARQELSNVLYQHDAACRVIARLTKEVNAAREALATLKPKTDTHAGNFHSTSLNDQTPTGNY